MMKTIYFYIALSMVLICACPVSAQTVVPLSRQHMQLSFAPLVKQAGPAVVNIYTKIRVRERVGFVSPFFNDPFFNRFFGGNLRGRVRERLENSLGSGVILDDSGLIVTNHHVVKQADEITVVTHDGLEFSAQKVLDDEKVDLAVLKIDPKGRKLTTLPLADSDALEVGDLILAIGNPFGVGQTVTSGIVSGLARTDIRATDYRYFIQTDAAINPGNSGGALIDMQGRLAGVNTVIFSRSGGSDGVGFAIPSNMVRVVLMAAKNGGKLIRPWVGLGSQDITADIMESLSLPNGYGTLVSQVVKDGPGDKAGIKVGDVLTAINGKDVQDTQALRFRLATVPVGEAAQITLWRQGKTVDVTLTATAPPEIPPRNETLIEGLNPLSGATVVNISPAVQGEIEGIAAEEGVVVVKVGQGRVAAMGLRIGDVILGVNGQDIKSVKDLVKAVEKPSRSWQVKIMRGNNILNVMVTG